MCTNIDLRNIGHWGTSSAPTDIITTNNTTIAGHNWNTSYGAMDYSYLNQAAASFDSSCLQGSMDPSGLGNMPCTYGDLTSCSQMSQAAYRYTAAAASMARTYNPVGTGVGPGGPSMGSLHHPGAPGGQCSVMGPRSHHQDHRTSMFSSSMSMQRMFF